MALVTQPRTRLAARIATWRLPAPTALADAQRPLPWRWLWLQALSAWGATRLAFVLLTLYYPLVTGSENPKLSTVALGSTIHRWMNWDSGIYVHLAQAGYSPPENSVFFPLYPALIRFCALIIGPHWVTAALLVSNLGALLAFGGVAALAAQVASVEHERQVARIALLLFAVYPLAFFTAAAYTDGLFVGLAAFALLCAMRRRWLLATACALLAAWSRPVGPALILPLAWETFQYYRSARTVSTPVQALRTAAPALAAICAPIISVLSFAAYLWQRFGDPLIIIHSERHWAHISMSPFISIPLAIYAFAHIAMNSPLQWRVLLDLAPVVGALIITLVAARRAPLALTLYTLGLLYIVTSAPINYTDLFVSGGRYMLAAIPVVITLAGWLRRADWLLPALCACGVALQAVLTIYFLAHGWIV